MKAKFIFMTIVFVAAAAVAQEDNADIETLDVTITLLPEGATTPEAVTRIIELPAAANDSARQRSADGIQRANDARGNRQDGLDTAAEARESGRALGQQMRERAQEDRENAGRGGPPDGAGPQSPPGPPGPPNGPPGPPQTPGPPGA
jgi:hypothetical protein